MHPLSSFNRSAIIKRALAFEYDLIVIGGGVSGAGKVLFESVRETILLRAMCVQAKRVRVVEAKLGVDAGIIGAGYLVRERLGKLGKEELR